MCRAYFIRNKYWYFGPSHVRYVVGGQRNNHIIWMCQWWEGVRRNLQEERVGYCWLKSDTRDTTTAVLEGIRLMPDWNMYDTLPGGKINIMPGTCVYETVLVHVTKKLTQ